MWPKKLVVLCVILAAARSAKILCVFPFPAFSHQMVYQPIWRALANRGHELTVLTTDPIRGDPELEDVTQISLASSYLVINKEIYADLKAPMNIIEQYMSGINAVFKMVEDQMKIPQVQDLIRNKTDQKFDLVIAEWFIPHGAVFSHKFDCPLVGVTSFETFIHNLDALGNPSHPVYNPEFTLPFGHTLNLLERAISVGYNVGTRLFSYLYYLPRIDSILQKYFDEKLPSIQDMQKRISVLLLNVNRIFHRVRPNVPAIIELGAGINIVKPKPLPLDLKTFLDNSTTGVVYFSLGSNVRSIMMGPEKVEIITETLGDLPFDVLWKWEDEHLLNKPKNVKISKWLPQQDVLRHPNIKLFITQGGLQSMEEAIYYKVPSLGIPFASEQLNNIRSAEKYGFTKLLDYHDITKESFKAAIMDVALNKKYKTNVVKISNLMRDEPMKAVDKAVWWIEYVIRHKGAKHLRSPSVDIPWYQYLLLDVIALYIVIVYSLVKIISKAVKTTITHASTIIYKSKIKSD